jgi:hypothetical protein
MEPRYRFPSAAALTPPEARFLGGVDRYDLWYGGDGRLIRIVWGNKVEDWDSYNTHTKLYYHNESGRPDAKDLELILKYVCLFAPDAAKALKLVED